MNNIVYARKHLLTLSVSRYSHPYWEFIYCTSGEGELAFDDQTLHYRTGDIVVIPPSVPHAYISKDGFTNIHLNLADCTLINQERIILSSEENVHILSAFTSALYYYSSDPTTKATLLPIYGNLIVAYVTLFHPAKVQNEIIQRIENHIVQNYSDCDYDLAEYLHSLPFSYDYLIKLFKNDLGITPHKYITELRLQAAADLLTLSRGNNISEIAHSCGFKDPLYFSRLFKKKYGTSPSFYALGGSRNADSDSPSLLSQETPIPSSRQSETFCAN
jgi:AraC-like DNA-binding protein